MSKSLIDVAYDIFIALLTGGYSGWLVSRYFAFHQEKNRAIDAIMNVLTLHEKMMNSPIDRRDPVDIEWLVICPIRALHEDGHHKAAHRIGDVAAHLATEAVNKMAAFDKGLADTPNDRQAVASVESTRVAKLIIPATVKMSAAEPNILSLLFGRGAANLLGRRFESSKNVYDDFTEHLETGRPISEIRSKRGQKK